MSTITAAAGGGNWNATGTWTGGVVPTAADDVLLAGTSGAVTITAAAVCRSLNCTGYTATLTHNSGQTLTIGDATAGASNIALKLVATMTYTLGNAATSAVSFASTSATQQTVTSGTKTLGNVTFAGVGGSWQLQDGLTTSGSFTASAANTFDANGQTITSSGAATTFSGGGRTFAAVSFTGSGDATITGANTFSTFTRTGTASKLDGIVFSADQIVTGTLTLSGNSTVNRLFVRTDTRGTQRTLSAATLTTSNSDWRDIVAAGAASWNLAAITGNSGDAGGNSGITFTASSTQTATGTASFSWSTHGWTTRVPLPQDDVVISRPFSASRQVTADMPRLGRNIDWTGTTGNVNWLLNATANTIYGSLTMVAAMTLSNSSGITFAGRSSHTITTAGQPMGTPITFAAAGGTYQLQDAFALSSTALLTLTSGTLDCNNQNVTAGTFTSTGTATRALTMGTGTWTITSSSGGIKWSVTSTGFTLLAASSTIVISSASASGRSFDGGGLTYGTLTHTVAGSAGSLTLMSSNTFGTINFSDASTARTLVITSGTTQVITTLFNVNGTPGILMGVTGGTLSKSAGVVACDYLNLTSQTATGGASFYAGVNSTDNGGNSGWSFTAVPPLTKTQTGTARIANAFTKTQTGVARIANTVTKTQTEIARVATTVTKTQSTRARVAVVVTKAQTSTAAIARSMTKTQSATARLVFTNTTTQTTTARIATNRTNNQPVHARIALGRAITQGALARVVSSRSKTQTAVATVGNVSGDLGATLAVTVAPATLLIVKVSTP